MSEGQLKVFLEKVKGDTSLQEKLKAAADVDAVVEIATAAGFSISADKLRLAIATIPKNDRERFRLHDLSDEELSIVRGGYGSWTEASNAYIGNQCQPRYWSA